MAVANSFKNYKILSEIFYKNNKPYIKAQNPNTGNIREIRWYEEELMSTLESKKKALGFAEEGYVYKLKGKIDEEKANASPLRYSKYIGWYLPPSKTQELPKDLTFTKLYWEDLKWST